MADLQELFARLNGGASSNQNQHGYQQPSVSSPIYSPSPAGQQPHHQSAIMSPNNSTVNTPAPEHGLVSQQTPQQQSATLLNLLRFNQPGAGQPRRVSQNTNPSDGATFHDRSTTASEMVASFMGGRNFSSLPGAAAPTSAQKTPSAGQTIDTSAENPQDLLLRLLNHPKPAQSDDRSSRASATCLFSPTC